MFGEVSRFIDMVAAVEEAALVYQRRVPPTMLREKTFFEKPISTVGLIVFTAVITLAVWMGIHQNFQLRHELLWLIGAYMIYVYIWYRWRKQRLRRT